MVGKEAQRHAVQKPPAPLGGLGPQPVHRGDKPEHTQNAAKSRLGGRLAVDPDLPGFAAFCPGFKLMRRPGSGELRHDLPPQRFRSTGDLGGGGAAQPAPRRQERDSFKDIRLACSVGAEKRDRRARKAQAAPTGATGRARGSAM